MSSLEVISYRSLTFFNDSFGERKILTRDLLRNVITSKSNQDKIVRLPRLIKNTPQAKVNHHHSSSVGGPGDIVNLKPKPIPFSLLQKIMNQSSKEKQPKNPKDLNLSKKINASALTLEIKI